LTRVYDIDRVFVVVEWFFFILGQLSYNTCC